MKIWWTIVIKSNHVFWLISGDCRLVLNVSSNLRSTKIYLKTNFILERWINLSHILLSDRKYKYFFRQQVFLICSIGDTFNLQVSEYFFSLFSCHSALFTIHWFFLIFYVCLVLYMYTYQLSLHTFSHLVQMLWKGTPMRFFV